MPRYRPGHSRHRVRRHLAGSDPLRVLRMRRAPGGLGPDGSPLSRAWWWRAMDGGPGCWLTRPQVTHGPERAGAVMPPSGAGRATGTRSPARPAENTAGAPPRRRSRLSVMGGWLFLWGPFTRIFVSPGINFGGFPPKFRMCIETNRQAGGAGGECHGRLGRPRRHPSAVILTLSHSPSVVRP